MADKRKIDPAEIQRQIDELDQQLDGDQIRKLYKLKLLQRIQAGEVNLLPELEELKKLEAKKHNPSPQPSPLKGEGEESPDEYGVPDKMKIKRRPYTLTPAALDQRKKAAKSDKMSAAMRGNKNAYKTGEYAQGFIRQVFRPCLSTCEKYPCAIVSDGETEPGEMCLDKVQFVRTLSAISEAMRDPKKIGDFKDIAALRIAGGLEVVDRLTREILEDGVVLKSLKYDGQTGVLIHEELKNHPALPFLAKLMETLNLTPQDMMTTPLIIKKQKTEEKHAKTLGDIMAGIGRGKGAKEELEDES